MTQQEFREQYIAKITDFLTDEDVVRTGTNEISFPVVINGEDEWLCLTFRIPKGSRDGEPFDGYAVAEDYSFKATQKQEKAQAKAEEKAKKMAKDAARRAAKKADKENHSKE